MTKIKITVEENRDTQKQVELLINRLYENPFTYLKKFIDNLEKQYELKDDVLQLTFAVMEKQGYRITLKSTVNCNIKLGTFKRDICESLEITNHFTFWKYGYRMSLDKFKTNLYLIANEIQNG